MMHKQVNTMKQYQVKWVEHHSFIVEAENAEDATEQIISLQENGLVNHFDTCNDSETISIEEIVSDKPVENDYNTRGIQ